jgi:2-aminoadipate transaminase
VRNLREVYRERRNAMLEALARHFPPDASWTHPAGGLFLWLTLPPGLDSVELLARALELGVAYVPGHTFHAAGGGERSMRLNFSFCPPPTIDEGIRRLAQAISEARGSAAS